MIPSRGSTDLGSSEAQPDAEVVANICATFVWDCNEAGFLRADGCNSSHADLQRIQFRMDERSGLAIIEDKEGGSLQAATAAFDSEPVADLLHEIAFLSELETAGLLHLDWWFDADLNALHLGLRLLRALCDDQSAAHAIAHSSHAALRDLAEFVVVSGSCQIDLRSDRDSDISAFLDSITPSSSLPECGPIPGLQCTLMPFQARAVRWALQRERHPETDGGQLDVLYDAVGDGLYVDRRTGRFTTVRFTDRIATIRGGMLCQTMGLGKTVEQIALIVAHPADNDWLGDDGGGYLERRRATLVVCPQALLGQWQQEVGRHAPSLRVAVVFSQGDFALLDDADLDVVLTAYETLRQQHVYQAANHSRRTSRRGRRATVHPVPFLQAEWWRVVLDEAQRVAGESAVTKAARAVQARHRWVMSGTPICRRLQDLGGLLRFIGHPLGERRHFEARGHRLRDVLAALMYRHGKSAVQAELALPPLAVDTVYVQLTDLEHIKYSKMIRRCHALMNVAGMQPETRTARLCRLLLALRKICCCPFLVDGRRADSVPASEALPILEIQKRISREAELEVDLARRHHVRCLTQLATTLSIAGRDYQRAETILESALAIVDDALVPFLTSDDDEGHRSGTRLEHVRAQVGRAVVLECLGRVDDARRLLLDGFAAVDAHLSAQLQTMTTTMASDSDDERDLDDFFGVCSARFSLAVFQLMMGQHGAVVADLRRLQASMAAYLAARHDDLQAAVGESAEVLACLRGRLEIELHVSLHRRALYRDLIALRISVLDCLLDLVTLAVIDDAGHDDAVRDRHACKTLLDALPMDRARTEVGFVPDASDDDDDNFRRTTLGENRAGFRLDPETISYLVLHGSIMTGLLRTGDKLHLDPPDTPSLTSRVSLISIVVGREAAPISARASAWLAALFSVLRTWLYLRQMLTNSDENDAVAGRCWERCFVIREELRNLYRRSFDQLETLFEEVRAGKAPDDVAGADLRRAQLELERAEHELKARQNELRYIAGKFEADADRVQVDDDDICPICRSDLMAPIVTPCGHLFCSSCLASYMVGGRGFCPLRCRHRFQFNDCLRIDDGHEPRRKRLKHDDDAVRADYGAKITDLLRRLIEMRRREPTAKSLVFSHWTDLLNVVRLALDEHGIGCVQLRGDGRQKALCIDRFVHSETMTVFLIPMAQGASGLTMVAARMAFIMEPGLNPTMEDQAINRIHRIGQTQATQVVKYIAKGTVEEPIAEIQQRHRATGNQAQKAFAPEVFDESILNDIFR